MRDLELSWPGSAQVEMHPARLPDLHAGDPLVVSLRLPPGVSTPRFELRGQTPSGPFLHHFRVEPSAAPGNGIATRWARAKVATLLDSLHAGADSDSIRQAVVDVGITHHLVTRYTSLVAVEEIVSVDGSPQSARVANALPHGSQLLRGMLPQGGTDQPRRTALALIFTLAGLLLLLQTGRRGRRRTWHTPACWITAVLLLTSGCGLLAEQVWLRTKAAMAGLLIGRALAANLRDGGVHKPWSWADLHPVARLEVPRLGVRRSVLSGATGATLAFGPGHVSETAAPNGGGHCVIAGHRDGAFAFLEELRTGDPVRVTTHSRQVDYEVVDTRVVPMEAVAVLEPTGTPLLLLVTCYPFRSLRRSDLRFVAVCRPAAGAPRSSGDSVLP
jgi:sortase A